MKLHLFASWITILFLVIRFAAVQFDPPAVPPECAAGCTFASAFTLFLSVIYYF